MNKTNTQMTDYKTITLTSDLAQLIYEGLAGTGWIDDADENLAYLVDEEGVEAAKQKMDQVNELITLINPLLDEPLRLIEEDLDTY